MTLGHPQDYGDEVITDTKALNNVMDVKTSRGR